MDKVLGRFSDNQIYNGDCWELVRELPDECIPLALTSPPYGNMRDYGGHRCDTLGLIDELYRVIRPGGIAVWVEQDQIKGKRCSDSVFEHGCSFRGMGFQLVSEIVLERAGFRAPTHGHYGTPEVALVFSKGKPTVINIIKDRPNKTAGAPVKHSVRNRQGVLEFQKTGKVVQPFGRRGCVWRYNAGFNNSSRDEFAFGHPAIMPEQVAEDLIIAFSRPGDLVLDPMCGSGTTLKMALLNHRRFLGFEIHEPYVEIARKRVRLAREEQQRRLDVEWGQQK